MKKKELKITFNVEEKDFDNPHLKGIIDDFNSKFFFRNKPDWMKDPKANVKVS